MDHPDDDDDDDGGGDDDDDDDDFSFALDLLRRCLRSPLRRCLRSAAPLRCCASSLRVPLRPVNLRHQARTSPGPPVVVGVFGVARLLFRVAASSAPQPLLMIIVAAHLHFDVAAAPATATPHACHDDTVPEPT